MNRRLDYVTASVGTVLNLEPITVTRQTLALYAGASGDHHPVHIDVDAARQAGFADVFAHGMLSMAYLGRLITDLLPQADLRSFEGRFVSITPVCSIVACRAEVLERIDAGAGVRLKLALSAHDAQTGDLRLTATAVVQQSVQP